MEFIEIESYQDLRVWNLAMQMADELYRLTDRFPALERENTVARSRREAVTLASAIAEGFTLGSPEAFSEHLGVARAALASVETQMLLARQRHFADPSEFDRLFRRISEISVLLRGLQKALKRQLVH